MVDFALTCEQIGDHHEGRHDNYDGALYAWVRRFGGALELA